ncbi:SOUL family heme-binding protein [Proteocatella sphenisci]|uniref:SOUL family heme-binding protein n=1 Tax=Proteocatella sphenisci TaxID=181070 RepID=UPI00048FD2D2|nr:heme-binding protein [Proteocatella sphenisci]
MAKYERPEYKVILSQPPFELRQYEEFVIVEYNNEADPEIVNGFGTLFRYISSENKEKQKISMTVPVIQEIEGNQMKMAFVVPKDYWENVPKPDSKWLSVKKFESGLFAVINYNGRSNKNKEKIMKKELSQWVDSKAYKVVANYMLAFYNPPFTPPMFRQNEIMVRIEK